VTGAPNRAGIMIIFNRRFSGELALFDVRGNRLASNRSVAGPGMFVWTMPVHLAGGIYLLAIDEGSGPSLRTRIVIAP
jgi:hypothetical protein